MVLWLDTIGGLGDITGNPEFRVNACPRYGLTHNLGGMPPMNISSITIVGR